MKYLPDEARALKNYGEIPDTVKIEEDNDIEFNSEVNFMNEPMAARGSDSDDSDEDDSDEDEADDIDNI